MARAVGKGQSRQAPGKKGKGGQEKHAGPQKGGGGGPHAPTCVHELGAELFFCPENFCTPIFFGGEIHVREVRYGAPFFRGGGSGLRVFGGFLRETSHPLLSSPPLIITGPVSFAFWLFLLVGFFSWDDPCLQPFLWVASMARALVFFLFSFSLSFALCHLFQLWKTSALVHLAHKPLV